MKHQKWKLSHLNLDDISVVNQIPACDTSIIISIKTKSSIGIHRFTWLHTGRIYWPNIYAKAVQQLNIH